MANSRVHGAFGLLKKSIGSLVYSRGKNGAGKPIQVVRQKPTEVYNPRTVGQILQRAKIKPAQRFFNALQEILDHSWQGVTYGTPSRNYFLSKALAQSGPYIPRSVTQVIPAAYPVSEGSIASILVSPVAVTEGEAIIHLETVQVDAATVQALVAAGVPEGAQLTIIAFFRRQSGEYAYAYGRLVNTVGSLFDWTGSTPAGMSVALDPATSTFHIDTADGKATVAVAAIVSRLSNGTWERSTQSLVLTDEMTAGLYGDAAMQITIESYGDTVDVNKLNSAWYLNLANGQSWPGRLTTVSVPLSGGAGATTVVIGQQILPNGSVRYVLFTDNGEAGGHPLMVLNGQIVPASNTASYVLSENGALYGYQVEPWVNVYATQLEAGGGSIVGIEAEAIWLKNNNQDSRFYGSDCVALRTSDGTIIVPSIQATGVGEEWRVDPTPLAYVIFSQDAQTKTPREFIEGLNELIMGNQNNPGYADMYELNQESEMGWTFIYAENLGEIQEEPTELTLDQVLEYRAFMLSLMA